MRSRKFVCILSQQSPSVGIIIVKPYDTVQKKAVRAKFRARAIQTLVGFLAALVSTVLSLLGYLTGNFAAYYSSVILLGISFVMVAYVAIMAVLQME